MKTQHQTIKSIVSGTLIAAFSITCLTLNVQAKTTNPLHNNAVIDTGKMDKMDKMENDKMSRKKPAKAAKKEKAGKTDKMAKEPASKM